VPGLPWEFIATRLGRFLQLGYIYAVVAGVAIISYWIAPNLGETSGDRRELIGRYLYQWTHPRPNEILSTVLILVGLFVACYLVGSIVRTLTYRVTSAVRTVCLNVFYATVLGRYWLDWRESGEPVLRRTYGDGKRWRYEIRVRSWRAHVPSWLTVPVLLLESASYVVPRRRPMKMVWEELVVTYGEEVLTNSLRRHPIKLSTLRAGHLGLYWEYCSSWLRANAPDEAITPRATNYLTASSLLVPVWLMTPWSQLYWDDVEGVVEITDKLAPWIILYFLYVLWGLRGAQVDAGGLFKRFVVVQLVEMSRESVPESPLQEPAITSRRTEPSSPSAEIA